VAALTEERIDTDALAEGVDLAACGAIVLFLGTTRNHHDGKAVVRLAYEAYAPMALAAMEAIEHEAAQKFEVVLCRIVHRLGEVPIGEASVAVLVASAHRHAAFDASRWAMDELKRTVPVWKKEFFEAGGEGWVKGTKLEAP
jgi:molybdopterin synthase catalytic subunit